MIKHLENSVPEHSPLYEWKSASVSVAGAAATTNITGISGFTTLFSVLPRAHRVSISAAGTIYVRINSSTNDVITITSTTPYSNQYLVTEKIFVSTGGANIAITVSLT